jgi:hypothetical protein
MPDERIARSGFFLENMEVIQEILRRSVREALLDHKRAGNPIASWRDGRMVLKPPNEIHLDVDANWTHSETP